MKMNILKSKGITGLSKMKATDLEQAPHDHFSEEELAGHFSIRGYKITPKGKHILEHTRTLLTVIQRKISKQATFWLAPLKLPCH